MAVVRPLLAALALLSPPIPPGPTAGPQQASPRSPAPSEAQVRALLSEAEPEVLLEAWQALRGEATARHLVGLARARGVELPLRVRAVRALGLLAQGTGAPHLRSLLATPTLPPGLREAAILALGACEGPGGLPGLERLLRDRSRTLRAAAARALGRLGTPEARRALEEALAEETDGPARETLQRHLTRMEP